jgi:hypothetical protein
MTSYRHSTVVGDNQYLDSTDSPSSHRCSERCRKMQACKYYLGSDSVTCRDRPLIVPCLFRPRIPFSYVAQLDKKTRQKVVPDHISNRSETRSRITMNGLTMAKVKDLHCPSKNGTSRPLRPPCLSTGSRFEHHLTTLLQKLGQCSERVQRALSSSQDLRFRSG